MPRLFRGEKEGGLVYVKMNRREGEKGGGIMLILSSIYHSRAQRPAVQSTLRFDK